MLIVACQVCGGVKILPGTPDSDGMARATWICECCGTGQVMQLSVSADARGGDLRRILGGMSFACSDDQVGAKGSGCL
jgi:hypothetical protein